ncbi:MAG: hypothetical protein ACPLN0_01740 [Candidatus Hydrothermia bacterium]
MLIETYPSFRKIWDGSVESWLEYINEYPELFEKIVRDFERNKLDFRKYTGVLLKRNATELELAYNSLLNTFPKVERKIQQYFEINNYNIVIYVGLENGAGWVTEFMGKPSLLFGLEAISELRWYEKLQGLIAHEFGHLVHWHLRGENIEKFENEPIFCLYVEGFAQRIEDLIMGRPWHVEEEGWFNWCEENEAILKREFLRRIKEREALNPFFGYWYELFGKRFTGYYLGYKFILWLEEQHTLEEIAKLREEDIKRKIYNFVI